jgi:hypothetical protein
VSWTTIVDPGSEKLRYDRMACVITGMEFSGGSFIKKSMARNFILMDFDICGQDRFRRLPNVKHPKPHPLFAIVPGGVRGWEKMPKNNRGWQMNFPKIEDTDRLQRLKPPTGSIRMVLDTDTYNEVDDQFAVVYALLSPEKLDLEAIYAAVAYLVEASWVPTDVVHSPILTDQKTWSFDDSRHLIRSANMVHRDPIFKDLFGKLASYPFKGDC